MTRHRRALRGFTLIELMIVVAILAIIALIVMPKFSNMIRKANESSSLGQLGNVRAAIRVYYMDNDQIFPANFPALRQANSKYLSGTINLYTGSHAIDSTVDDVPFLDPLADVGQWGYVSNGTDLGSFWIQCTHTDSTGKMWSSY